MADFSAIGAEGAEFDLFVEHGKVREFALATRATHPSHFRGETQVPPATFLTTILFWQELTVGANPWSLVKLDLQRGMHAEQEYVFYGPPPAAGTRLKCRSRIESVYDKEGRRGGKLTFAVMVTEFRDPSGKLVAEARLTGVETEKPPLEST
jgi:hypothetical protein